MFRVKRLKLNIFSTLHRFPGMRNCEFLHECGMLVYIHDLSLDTFTHFTILFWFFWNKQILGNAIDWLLVDVMLISLIFFVGDAWLHVANLEKLISWIDHCEDIVFNNRKLLLLYNANKICDICIFVLKFLSSIGSVGLFLRQRMLWRTPFSKSFAMFYGYLYATFDIYDWLLMSSHLTKTNVVVWQT